MKMKKINLHLPHAITIVILIVTLKTMNHDSDFKSHTLIAKPSTFRVFLILRHPYSTESEPLKAMNHDSNFKSHQVIAKLPPFKVSLILCHSNSTESDCSPEISGSRMTVRRIWYTKDADAKQWDRA